MALDTTLLVFVDPVSTKYDLRVVSNMKTDRTPCCYRQCNDEVVGIND